MRRRDFIKVVACSAITWPLAAQVQQPEQKRLIGVLMPYAESDSAVQSWLAAFRAALAKLGWSEGSNLRIELRWSAADPDKNRTFAKELVDLRPDAIFGVSTPAIGVLARETRTIPIVFAGVTDPIGSGFAANLAHPGGNITGFTVNDPAVGGKWGGAIEGDRAAHRARGFAVQSSNSRADPILHAFHSSRRIILCHRGKCRSGSRQG